MDVLTGTGAINIQSGLENMKATQRGRRDIIADYADYSSKVPQPRCTFMEPLTSGLCCHATAFLAPSPPTFSLFHFSSLDIPGVCAHCS